MPRSQSQSPAGPGKNLFYTKPGGIVDRMSFAAPASTRGAVRMYVAYFAPVVIICANFHFNWLVRPAGSTLPALCREGHRSDEEFADRKGRHFTLYRLGHHRLFSSLGCSVWMFRILLILGLFFLVGIVDGEGGPSVRHSSRRHLPRAVRRLVHFVDDESIRNASLTRRPRSRAYWMPLIVALAVRADKGA